jgi:hypothetical protein
MTVRLHRLITFVKTTVIELNMFTENPSNEPQVRYQRNATRLYILLIIMALIIVIHRKTVPHPTESRYARLE